MATAPAEKKTRRSNGPAKPKPVFLLYNVVGADGVAIPGAKLEGVEIVRNGDDMVDRIASAADAGETPPQFVRFFLPKTARAKKDTAAA